MTNSTVKKYSWKEHTSPETDLIQDKVVLIEETQSLWYSTHSGQGENGMVEYDYNNNELKQIVKYPKNIYLKGHCCCTFDNKIYIIDSKVGKIYLFNPSTKQFKKLINIDKLGPLASCEGINNEIHIIGGTWNKKHFIYSINNNTIHTINNTINKTKIFCISMLKYQDKLIQFGGYDNDNDEYLDRFCSYSIMQQNKWTLKPQFKLKQPLLDCGCIIYKNYILTFGGQTVNGECIDKIYLLHLKNNNGWIEIKEFQCPIKSCYRAVLDTNGHAHLFTYVNKEMHYSIDIKPILGRGEILLNGYMRIYIFGENCINESQYDVSINGIIIDYIGVITA